MTPGIEALKIAFRDYVIANLPSSGDNDPSKSEIRTALDILDSDISGILTGLIPYATIAARNAAAGIAAGQLAYVYNNNGSASDPLNGVYQYVSGSWVAATWYFDSLVDIVQPLVDEAAASAATATAAANTLSALFYGAPKRIGRVIMRWWVEDSTGRLGFGVSSKGALVSFMQRLMILGRNRAVGFIWSVQDSVGKIGFGLDLKGRIVGILSPGSWEQADRLGQVEPEQVIRRGVLGTITEVKRCRSKPTIRFKTDKGGIPKRFAMRLDTVYDPTQAPVIVFDASQYVQTFISYGQSWRSQQFALSAYRASPLNMDNTPDRVFGFQVKNGVYFPPNVNLAKPATATTMRDLRALSWDTTSNGDPSNASGSIGLGAAMCYARLAAADAMHEYPVLDYCYAYPAQYWPNLKPGGTTTDGLAQPWSAGLILHQKARDICAFYAKTPLWMGVGFTHQAYDDGYTDADGVSDYYTVLGAMVTAFDALALNGAGGRALTYFIDQTAPISSQTKAQDNILRQMDYALAFPSRVIMCGPRYPYAFSDSIHHTGDGNVKVGLVEGLAKHYVLNKGLTWTPYRITTTTKTTSTKITLTTTAPMTGFSGITVDTTSIEAAPQYGFHVRKVSDGSEVTVALGTLTNTSIELNLGSALTSGQDYEISYAYRGPGATSGTHTGVWGNIKFPGPKNPFLPTSTTDTIDAWLCVYKTTITA